MSVHVFPLASRHDLVQKIAFELFSRNSESANVYWRDTAKQLLMELGDTGTPRQEAERQVRSLFYVVLAAIREGSIGGDQSTAANSNTG